jgi:ABC-type lipoprotein release transport system permease subunit
MLSLFRTLSLRYLWKRWSRSALVIASIALGVATWVATDALSRALDRSLKQAVTPLGIADVYVTDTAKGGIDPVLAPRVRKIPGVKRVDPLIIEKVTAARNEADLKANGDPNAEAEKRRPAILVGLSVDPKLVSVSADPKKGEGGVTSELEQRGIEVVDFSWRALGEAVLWKELPVLVGQEMDENFLGNNKQFVILADGKPHRLRRFGQVRAHGHGPSATLGGYFVVTIQWETAAELVGRKGRVDRLDVTLHPDTDRADAIRRIKEVAKDTEVQSAEEQDQRINELTRGMRIAFLLCGAGALVVGLFLVYNAMSVSVSERRHDIGILRSVGATRAQIRGLFFGEAVLLGVAGSALGVPLGIGLATASLGPMQRVMRGLFRPMQGGEVETTPELLLTAALAGLATALLAALVPASRAAAEEPADAVRRAAPPVSVVTRLFQVGGSVTLIVLSYLLMTFKPYLSAPLVTHVGLGLLAASIPLLVAGYCKSRGAGEQRSRGEPETAEPRRGLRAPLASAPLLLCSAALLVVVGAFALALRDSLGSEKGLYVSIALSFVGSLLLASIVATFLTRRVVRPVVRAILPVPSRLAADDMVRSPGRTGLVTAAFAAGVALMVQTAGVIHSNEGPVLEWVDATFQADLYIASGGPASATGETKEIKESVKAELKQELPKGTRLVGVGARYVNWNPEHHLSSDQSGPDRSGTVIYLILRDIEEYCRASAALPNPDPHLDTWRKAIGPGKAIVSENFALIHRVKVGDSIQLKGQVQFKVVATMPDYSWIRGSVLIDRQANKETMGGDVVNIWEVYLPRGAEAEPTREQLQRRPVAARHTLFTATRAEMRDGWQKMIHNFYGVAYTQELIVAMVAVLGVVASLLISVLGRRRELGILRAVGGTRPQVLQTVLAEAALIGLVGTLLGIAVGLPMEWYAVRVVLFGETGFLFPVRPPWAEAALIAALSILAATLAGIGPAIHATRLRIADAIAYE